MPPLDKDATTVIQYHPKHNVVSDPTLDDFQPDPQLTELAEATAQLIDGLDHTDALTGLREDRLSVERAIRRCIRAIKQFDPMLAITLGG